MSDTTPERNLVENVEVEFNPADEEVDVEPFEGMADFKDAPWANTVGGVQDDGED